jgi:hypothetical protein
MRIHLSSGGSELGDSFGALRDGVLGQLSRKEKSDGGLDLARRQGGLLVVARQAGSLKGKALEDIVDERVQDGHASLGDASVGVDLLQHLVDVRRVGLDSLGTSLASRLLGSLDCFLSDGWGWCFGHFVSCWIISDEIMT